METVYEELRLQASAENRHRRHTHDAPWQTVPAMSTGDWKSAVANDRQLCALDDSEMKRRKTDVVKPRSPLAGRVRQQDMTEWSRADVQTRTASL